MSFGDHAKMYRFSRRELVSLLSYLAAGADDDKLGWVTLVQQDLLGVIGRLELLHW
jgi:hypothetical protein